MRSFVFFLVALSISADVVSEAQQPKLSRAEQEVLDVSLARRDASNRRDMATLGALHRGRLLV